MWVKNSKENQCRICLDTEEETDEGNPLISPWKWSGSMKHVHLECLKLWIHDNRKQRTAKIVKSYHWKKLQCELCKEYFKVDFKDDYTTYKLLDYDEPTQDNYLVLESYSTSCNLTLHWIDIPNEKARKKKAVEISLGRVNNLEVRITDASVSRLHSIITFHNGNFYIKDMESKFGTLVFLRTPILIPNEQDFCISLQSDNTYFEIHPKILNWCCCWFDDHKQKVHPDNGILESEEKLIECVPASFK